MIMRDCAPSRRTFSFQTVQSLTAFGDYTGIFPLVFARIREEDSYIITLKPKLTLYFQAVQSLTAFEGYTGNKKYETHAPEAHRAPLAHRHTLYFQGELHGEDSNITTLKPMLQRRTGSRCFLLPIY